MWYDEPKVASMPLCWGNKSHAAMQSLDRAAMQSLDPAARKPLDTMPKSCLSQAKSERMFGVHARVHNFAHQLHDQPCQAC